MHETTHLPDALAMRLSEFRQTDGHMVVLTGAGISAESGIPTFRGKDGIWVVGSREYQPMSMATLSMFRNTPEHVWAWYLYRVGVCRTAAPNAGHEAVVKLEQLLEDRFLLITQNVDGLHLRAGSSPARTYQIHGNIEYVRCANECGQPNWPLDEALRAGRPPNAPLTAAETDALACPACGGWARPHVLWFDEYYDEENFRFESSLAAAQGAAVLLVVGTSGATNLPMQVGQLAARRGATIIDVNLEPNPFSQVAEQCGGFFLQGPSSTFLPAIDEAIRAP